MQKLVMSKPAVFDRFAAFINIFVGLQTQRREITGHVEYEIEWTKAFAILAELSKCCREVGAAARWASPTELLAGMGSLANRMLSDAMLQSTTLDPEMYKMPILHEVKDVLVHGSSFTLLQEEVVHIKAFSFHHYLHYFFAELLKWVGPVFQFGQDGFRGYTFRALIDKFILRNQKSTEDADKMLLTILEYPLRSKSCMSNYRLTDSVCDPLPNSSGHVEEERCRHAGTTSPLPRDLYPGLYTRPGLLSTSIWTVHDRPVQIYRGDS